jgi:hypothetical protein
MEIEEKLQSQGKLMKLRKNLEWKLRILLELRQVYGSVDEFRNENKENLRN